MQQPEPTELERLKGVLAQQEQTIKEYVTMLDTAPPERLVALCMERSIPVRKTFTNRCALVLAKKNELHYFELCGRKAELEELEARRAGKIPEVYSRIDQLNCPVEFLEEGRYHLFCEGDWQYSLKSAQIAIRYYRSLQRLAPVTLLAGREIVCYGRMKPIQGQRPPEVIRV